MEVYVELLKDSSGQIHDVAPILCGEMQRAVTNGVEIGWVQVVDGKAVAFLEDSDVRVFHIPEK